MPLYQLSLEERKTCPKSCPQWTNCYGNNMPFGKRIDVTDRSAFYARLSSELDELSVKHPHGYVIRLHVLGDFFDVGYTRFWEKALKEKTGLRLFGYTHRPKNSPIGRGILRLNAAGAWVRWSDAGGTMSANLGGARGSQDIQCPQEVGKTTSCLTCGLCWQTTRAIGFLEH